MLLLPESTRPLLCCCLRSVDYKSVAQERTGGLWKEEEYNPPPRDCAHTVRNQEEKAPLEEQTHDGQHALRRWPSATGLAIHGP